MPFLISYMDGTEVTGSYISDTLSIGELTIEALTMGLGEEQSGAPPGLDQIFLGIMGVGFETHEAGYVLGDEATLYPNVISQLKMQGLINTRAFSVWLHPDGESSVGSSK